MSEPVQASTPGERQRRKRARSSLLTRGEPMLWLTGGGLALSLWMIAGLLLLVVWQGVVTFWPSPVVNLTLHDGSVVAGEVTRIERFAPGPEVLDAADEAEQLRIAAALDADGTIGRALVRTGNFDIDQTHFAWVDDHQVDAEAQPEWAVVFERTSWGRFYGEPTAYVQDGEVITEGAAAAWAAFEQAHAEQRKRYARIHQLKKYDLGAINHHLDAARLATTAAVIEHGQDHPAVAAARAVEREQAELQQGELGLATFERELVKARFGADSDEYQAASQASAERIAAIQAEVDAIKQELRDVRHAEGIDSAAYQSAFEAAREAVVPFEGAAGRVNLEIAELEAENQRYALRTRTFTGVDKDLIVSEIVRAYPANQLGTGGKLGVYVSRWWEFLADDPREANSEGGVWPAIFGTVIMTLIMTIMVVPFGVLAALYLREYAKAGPLVSVIRIAINNLAGVPSIVFGVFGLGFFCYVVGGWIDGGPDPASVIPLRWWFVLILLAVATIAAAIYATVIRARFDTRKAVSAGTMMHGYVAGLGALALFLLIMIIIVGVNGGLFIAGLVIAMMIRGEMTRDRVQVQAPSWITWAPALGWASAVGLVIWTVWLNPWFNGFYFAKLPNPTFGTGGILWASLTLALLTLPVVIVATEEALAAVPRSMREGSYACGASKWQTIKRIVLPRAMPGIMTGTILAMARGAGEVAPLMLVGAVKLAPELPFDIANWGGSLGFVPTGPLHAERSFMHLGFHIFDLGFQSQNSEAARPMVYTTTLLLIAIVVALNLAAIYLRGRLRRRFTGGAF